MFAQTFLLGGLFVVATILVFGSIAMAAGTLSQRFGESERLQVVLDKLAALVFVGIALRLGLAEQH